MQRQTKQREAVLEALRGAGRALTAEELWAAARPQAPRLGVRTVYRQIRELIADGQLVGLDYPGQPPRYELANPEGHHSHLVCRGCGKLWDLPGEPVVQFTPPPGFVVTGEEVVFYGWCPHCKPAR